MRIRALITAISVVAIALTPMVFAASAPSVGSLDIHEEPARLKPAANK